MSFKNLVKSWKNNYLYGIIALLVLVSSILGYVIGF